MPSRHSSGPDLCGLPCTFRATFRPSVLDIQVLVADRLYVFVLIEGIELIVRR